MWFTLMIADTILTKDIINTVAYLCSRTVSQDDVHSTSKSNFIQKGVDELPVTSHSVNTHEITSTTNEELSTSTPPLSFNVEEDSITTNDFMSASNIRSRKMRSNMISYAADCGKMRIISCCGIEGMLDHLARGIKKEPTVTFKVSRKFTMFMKIDMVIHSMFTIFSDLVK